MTKKVFLVSFCTSVFFYLVGMILYVIPVFRINHLTEFPPVKSCVGLQVCYNQRISNGKILLVKTTGALTELDERQTELLSWLGRMVPLLMLIFALCNMARVVRFKEPVSRLDIMKQFNSTYK